MKRPNLLNLFNRPRRVAAVLAATVCATAAIATSGNSAPAQANPLLQFNPGYIVSDEVFYNYTAMTEAQVSQFISDRGAGCTAASNGVPCLKDYRAPTTYRSPDAYCPGGYTAEPNESAARTITKVAASCRINPQVLLVMLQKEQGLLTARGNGLTERRYDYAMGYACPDSTGCNPMQKGFFNQLYRAAHRLQEYRAHPTKFNYQAGRVNNIKYSPRADCPAAPVNILNQATAALYIYTPYQPNAAALAAGWNLGDQCSSYGNRNFYNYFNAWFGSTITPPTNSPFGKIESVQAHPDGILVYGWALDPDTTAPINTYITVDNAAYPSAASAYRADLEKAFPGYGGNHMFMAKVPASPGRHQVCVTAENLGLGSHMSLGCQEITMPGETPFGYFDAAENYSNMLRVRGWAIDPAVGEGIAANLEVKVDGNVTFPVQASFPRFDTLPYFPFYGGYHGFDQLLPISPGWHKVCIDIVGAKNRTPMGCKEMGIPVPATK